MAGEAVTAYIEQAPEDQQRVLARLRGMIEESLPATTPEMSGFPVYTLNGEWIAGFATRKKGPMLYIMKTEILDQYEGRLGKARSGRSCVDFEPTDEMWSLAEEMLAATREKVTG